MNLLKRMGLRWRLALVAALTLGVASTLGGAWVLTLLRSELVQDVYTRDRVVAEGAAGRFGSADSFAALTEGESEADPNAAFLLVGGNGQVLDSAGGSVEIPVEGVQGQIAAADVAAEKRLRVFRRYDACARRVYLERKLSEDLEEGLSPLEQCIRDLRLSLEAISQTPQQKIFRRDGKPIATTVVPVLDLETLTHTGLHIVVGSPLTAVDRVVKQVRFALLFVAPLLALAAGALVWLAVGRSLRNVEAIRTQVVGIAHGTLDHRVPEPGTSDEIGLLASTMNDMLDRLERGAIAQHHFVANASHELRSPIASLRAQLEVALAHPEHADWKEVAQDARAEGLRLEQLIDQLLEIASLEEGTARIEPDTSPSVQLDLVARAEAARLRDPRIEVAPETAEVFGDEALLERAAQNLIQNACRYARNRIAVSTGVEGGFARLIVEDDGPGIPAEDRARVLDRFARVESGRGRDSGGTGLGLALSAQIARLHGGEIRIDDSPLGGARVTLELPASPPR